LPRVPLPGRRRKLVVDQSLDELNALHAKCVLHWKNGQCGLEQVCRREKVVAPGNRKLDGALHDPAKSWPPIDSPYQIIVRND